MNGESKSAAATLRGKRADLVVVIQSPKVDPEMTHFSWYIPVDACTRGWCEPNVNHLEFFFSLEWAIRNALGLFS